jgi:VWFA-related protein
VVEFARIACIALLAVLAQSVRANEPPSQAQQPPRFRGGTNMVRVDAFATKGGVPVQDLTAADFDVLEDGTPQKIDTFEHVVVQAAAPGARVDPVSVSDSIQQAGDPHRRVFVLYLDIEHVDVSGTYAIRGPLIDLLNRVMGDDDLVGVMTPEMGPQQITFARKTQVIEADLWGKYWDWGRRDEKVPDEQEQLYQQCYPPGSGQLPPSKLAQQMMTRRRERMVLDSLHDLARYMESIREGRTAVITVSPGWVLFKPDSSMGARIGNGGDPTPGGQRPIGVGGGGTLSTRPVANPNLDDQTTCDKERTELANLDDDQYLKNVIGEANRAEVSFYTIDPRGIAVFDSIMGASGQQTTVPQDFATLKLRHESLETLSGNTDGLALTGSNDLNGELRKIADDLTSYYLIGYYSTNTKLDGRFRTIKVRSKRSGVEVRARQGYRAATEKEVSAATSATALAVPDEKAALSRALGAIESDARAQGRATTRGPGEPLVFHRGPSTANQMQPTVARIFPRSDRLHLELETVAGAPLWTGAILDRNGTKTAVPVSAGERTDAGGQHWLTADVTLAPLGAGDYVIQLTSSAGTEQKRTLVAIRVSGQ